MFWYASDMSHANADLQRFLHAIADSARRRILHLLRDPTHNGALCAAEIEHGVKLSQPTISHHMRVLEKAGLVEVKREGHFRRYRRNEKWIAEMTRSLRKEL